MVETRQAQPILSEAERALRERFQPIFDEIRDGAIDREQSRELAFEAVERLRKAGFLALRIAREHGGSGATLPELFRLLVALGEADSNLPQILRAHFAFVEGRLNAIEDTDREAWYARVVDGALFGAAMAERTAATETTVTLTRADDHWVLNGDKYYSTGTIYANWIVAAARDGETRVSLAVPANLPGVTVVDDWDGFGQRLTGSGTTRFRDVRLDDAHVIRRFEPGQHPADSYITAFYQAFHLAALAGIANAVLRDAVAFVQQKTRTFGVPGLSAPRQDPLVQRVIGRLSSLAFSASAIVDQVAQTMQTVHDARLNGTAQVTDYSLADIQAFQGQQIVIGHVLEAASLLFEIGGASAVSESRRLDRHWRNARTLASHNPAIQRERAIGDFYLNGKTPDAVWREAFEKTAAQGNDTRGDNTQPEGAAHASNPLQQETADAIQPAEQRDAA
ncbi:MAG TPA: acyl-CoA dehydrogenase family protein [Pararobbsia sp.]|nr:acyl-CoA dehydrogenase family protein [Pararobbsia sp.]